MRDSRLPKLLFALLGAYAAIHFLSYYSQLPTVVASHFNGQGLANGWQTKPAFFTVFAGVSVLIIIITFDYAIQSNLHPNNRHDVSRMWYILAGFVVFIVVWITRIFLRFGRRPQGSSSLNRKRPRSSRRRSL